MKRREFILAVGGAAAAWPLAARAQQERMRRIGILMAYPKGDPELTMRLQAFRQELAKLGWTQGVNVQLDRALDRGRYGSRALRGGKSGEVKSGRVLLQLSRTIQIVAPGASDPVGVGWATSLARPGGNLTGFTTFELSIFGKSLALLKQIAPRITRVAFIYNPDNPNTAFYRRSFEAASGPLAVEPIDLPIHGLADIERAVDSFADRQNTGLSFPSDLTTVAMRNEIVALVARHHLPAIYSDPAFVRIGGLAFYGSDRVDQFRRAAGYVDRILRGEQPGDLPFQQPTKYQFILNLKTAKAMGLDLSPTLVALADEVIE